MDKKISGVETDKYENRINADKQEVHDFTNNGECSRCGACCSVNIPLSDNEVKTIKEYVQNNGIEAARHIEPGLTVDFTCPFLNWLDNGTTECLINNIKPFMCGEFKCDTTDMAQVMDIKKSSPEEYLSTLKTRNMGQEFFPDIFTPKAGDIVVPTASCKNAEIRRFRRDSVFIMLHDNNDGTGVFKCINGEYITDDPDDPDSERLVTVKTSEFIKIRRFDDSGKEVPV